MRASSLELVAILGVVGSLGLGCGGSATPPPPAPTIAECGPTACGPALGMPMQQCDDGSVGGNTGKCIRQGETCGWEIRECPAPAAGCTKSGCSGTVCAETGKEMMTTCEYRPEYACYGSATCERQKDGACNWTPTPELTACLAKPPPMQ